MEINMGFSIPKHFAFLLYVAARGKLKVNMLQIIRDLFS
jgi:hypothetical protein